MSDTKSRLPRTLQEDREAYFSGRISAHEYLNRALSVVEPDRKLTAQFRRIIERLTGKDRPKTP